MHQDYSITHAYGECNQVADGLADLNHNVNLGSHIFYVIPRGIDHLISLNCMGVPLSCDNIVKFLGFFPHLNHKKTKKASNVKWIKYLQDPLYSTLLNVRSDSPPLWLTNAQKQLRDVCFMGLAKPGKDSVPEKCLGAKE